MKRQRIWINGRLLDKSKAVISVFDRGFLYGDGVFETMRSYAGVVFMIDEHLSRLNKSLAALKIKKTYSADELKKGIYRTLEANHLISAYIRMTVTRGEGEPGINYAPDMVSNYVIMAKEFDGYPVVYKNGITATIAKTRQNDYSPVSRMKSTSFLNYVIARRQAKDSGCDEAILIDNAGYIAEAATGNIFLVKNEMLVTPPTTSPILPGITRDVVLKIAGKLKIAVCQKRISRKELFNSDEVFLTNSLAEIVPVVRIDSRRIGRGRPGELTKLLHISYQKEVIRSVVA